MKALIPYKQRSPFLILFVKILRRISTYKIVRLLPRKKKRLAAVLGLVFLFMVLSGVGFNNDSEYEELPLSEPVVETPPQVVKDGLDILFYTGYHDEVAPSFTVQCPQKCNIINDFSKVNMSDAVLFHIPNVKSLEDIPRYHDPKQKWVFFTMEGPRQEDFERFTEFNRIFNITMTYRRDSDIHVPFANLIPITPGEATDATDILDREPPGADKSKIAAWFTKSCNADSKAHDYVKLMKRVINVDTFGECGKGCSEGNYLSSCLREINVTHKFYLSFENSLCRDYISENLWTAFSYSMVPVVLGAGNYSEVLPAKSYIDIKNFRTPKELSRFLTRLHRNADLYKEYFDWKEKYKVEIEDRDKTFCRLCNHLYATSNHGAVIDNIQEWWYDCVDPKLFYKDCAVLLTK